MCRSSREAREARAFCRGSSGACRTLCQPSRGTRESGEGNQSPHVFASASHALPGARRRAGTRCGPAQHAATRCRSRRRGHVAQIPNTREFIIALRDHPEYGASHTVWGQVRQTSSTFASECLAATLSNNPCRNSQDQVPSWPSSLCLPLSSFLHTAGDRSIHAGCGKDRRATNKPVQPPRVWDIRQYPEAGRALWIGVVPAGRNGSQV